MAHGLKPHLFRTFKISRDPNFVEKLEDVIGLYLSPPDNAIVLSCDEKSQIQALDRTQRFDADLSWPSSSEGLCVDCEHSLGGIRAARGQRNTVKR